MEHEVGQAVELIKKVDLPIKNPASLAYHENGVWVADIEGASLLLVDTATGRVMTSMRSTARRPQTISWDGAYLWEYDEVTSNLYKRRPDSTECRFFGQVEGVVTPYLGLAYHHDTLWLVSPDQPFFTVSNNLITVVKFPRRIKFDTFEAPLYSCRGLCHDGRYLWTMDVEGRELFALDALTGEIITSYELPGVALPSSLVVTEDRIWTLDLKDNSLLTYRLDRSVPYSRSGGRRSHVEIVHTQRNNGPGLIKELEFFQSLPFDYVNQEIRGTVTVAPSPDERYPLQWEGEGGETVLHRLRDMGPNQEQEVCVAFDVDTYNISWHIYPHRVGKLGDIPRDVRERYLFSEMMRTGDETLKAVLERAQYLFQTEEKTLRDKAEHILDGESNPFRMARRIYDFVVDKIGYILPYMSLSSLKILEQSRGSCGNHTTIYIALCQAAGLPCRSIIGFSLWKGDSRLGYLDHELPEVYLPGYGWIPADTSRFMSLPVLGTHPITKYRSFGTFNDRLFVNGFGRDLRSPLAQKNYLQEPLMRCEGECSRDSYFFIRWQSEVVSPG